MKKLIKLYFVVLIACFSCTDLDVPPKSIASGNLVFEDPASYRPFLAKIYAGFSVTGQQGPAGNPDIFGIDEGFSSYIRQYWQLQELPTDEAVIGWADGNLPSLNYQKWTDDNEFVSAMYYRIFYNISLVNEFLRESADSKLEERGFSESVKEEIREYRAEVRFVRALSYFHGLDLFGSIPFFTEEDDIGSTAPDQATPQQIYEFIETELTAIESELRDPKTNEYGRADKAAIWALQAKLYLNAQVYTGTSRYDECIEACSKIIESGQYALNPEFTANFGADNHLSEEIIFAAIFDGQHIRTWGGTTYLVNAAIGGAMSDNLENDTEFPGEALARYGVGESWGGIRTTSAIVDLFPDVTGDEDGRAIFFTEGQSLEIIDISEFTNGYAVPKWTNKTSTGQNGSHPTHPDTDFPFFRLADVYLMYAEAVLRGGEGGSMGAALGYVNELRERAYGDTSGNLISSDLTLDFILDERARELLWEAHRRTDLIRFERFTTNGIWPWKGEVPEGQVTAAFRNVYPIPAAELVANPKLKQNNGY